MAKLKPKTLLEQGKTPEPTPAYMPSPDERIILNRLKRRIFSELQPARQTIIATDERQSIEAIWRESDKLYPPHRYYSTSLEDWQSKNSQPQSYSKIMTALSTIISQRPEVRLKAATAEYEMKTNLMKALYRHSWDVGLSLHQLRMFVFNLAKYGFAVGRTYHRKLTRQINDLVFVDPETAEETYEQKEIDDPNDVYFENMNIWNCWFDDMAVPNDMWSCRDWCFRQVYPLDSLPMYFPEKKFPNIHKVLAGGDTSYDSSGTTTVSEKQLVTKDLVEVYFYENQITDEFHIMANNVLLTPKVSPLPYKHKRLSCVFTQWTPRSAHSIYGIGVIEVLKEDQDMLDKVRNMSFDQLVLSIYQMFFHGPSTNFAEGKLRVAPGRLVQVTNPDDVKPVKFSTPGADLARWIEMIQSDMDESTGITKALSGEFIGKTAFEAQQNKEAGLRKLKIPLENLDFALTIEARNRIDLIQQIYSTPLDIQRIAGGKRLQEFLTEMEQSPELYTSTPGGKVLRARETRLNLEQTQEKGFQESRTTNTINLTPDVIRWEGEISIQPQSTLKRSEELERQFKLDLFNVIGQLPTISIVKATRQILKAFNEDPDDWMPTAEETAAKEQLNQQADQQMGSLPMEGPEVTENQGLPTQGLPTMVPRSETEPTQRSPVAQILGASQGASQGAPR